MDEKVKVGQIDKPIDKLKWLYFVGKDGGVFAMKPKGRAKKVEELVE